MDIGQIAVTLVAVGHIIGTITSHRRGVPIDGSGFRCGRHVDSGGPACLLRDDDVSTRFQVLQVTPKRGADESAIGDSKSSRDVRYRTGNMY